MFLLLPPGNQVTQQAPGHIARRRTNERIKKNGGRLREGKHAKASNFLAQPSPDQAIHFSFSDGKRGWMKHESTATRIQRV